MREYVLQQAMSRQPYGRLTTLFRLVANWQARNDVRQLMCMDDYILKDMGLDRDMLARMARMSLWADQAWERDLPASAKSQPPKS